MPRLSAQELQEAKRKKAEERILEEQTRALEEQRLAEERALEKERLAEEQAQRDREATERDARLSQLRDKLLQVSSVIDALYVETSKLSIKWPTMPITTRTLERTNKVIRTTKELLRAEHNEFIQDINEFIPAGDIPENRDVVIILKELKNALDRTLDKYQKELNVVRKKQERGTSLEDLLKSI